MVNFVTIILRCVPKLGNLIVSTLYLASRGIWHHLSDHLIFTHSVKVAVPYMAEISHSFILTGIGSYALESLLRHICPC